MLKNKNCAIRNKILICFKWLLCIFFISTFLPASAQSESEKGLPFITNYAAKTYEAFPQTWCVQQDDRGIMYFGIDRNVLEYDGIKWRKIDFINNTASTIVRALTKDKDGVIYYGAYGDLGYLTKDSLGQTIPKSLLDDIPKANRNFLDVWSSYATDAGIYFQSREYIFRLSNNKTSEKSVVKVWKPQTKFMYSFYIDGDYYVHQQGLGLYKMIDDSLVFISGSEFLGKERMQIMLPYLNGPNKEKQYLVGMFYSGLYIYNRKTFRPFFTKANSLLKSGTILYKGLRLKNGNYVLLTTGNGLVVMDANGNLLQKINRDVGLQDESIYAAFQDSKDALWLGLDNGISRVEISSPLTKFTLQSGISTGVLTIQRFGGIIYIGTTNGLLQYDSSKQFFEPVPGIPQNQIFSLLPDGDELLVPGDGLFAIKDKKTITIRPSVSGDLTVSSLYIARGNPNILYCGGQFGMAIFTRKTLDSTNKKFSDWYFASYISGISGQVGSISEATQGKVWVGTGTGIVYRLTIMLDENGNLDKKKTVVEIFGAPQGLKNGVGVVVRVKGIPYFIADSFLYTFNDIQNKFVPDTTFGKLTSLRTISLQFNISEDSNGRVWIRTRKETVLAIPKPGGGYTFDSSLLKSIGDYNVRRFYPEKNGVLWICTTDGLIRYDENIKENIDASFKTILRHIEAGNQELNVDNNGNTNPVSISFKNSTLRFVYAAPFFEQEEKTQYQTWLEGFEKAWTSFDNNYYKEYTNLPPGEYHFHVRAKNVYGKLSAETVYSFSIQPPWYRTWWAYLLYALAAISLVYFFINWKVRRLKEQHAELEKTVEERTAQLSQRVGELSVINSVQEGLVAQMNMEQIYTLVGDRIRDLSDAQTVVIRTYDHENKLENYPYAIEKGERLVINPRPFDDFTNHLMNLRKPEMVNENFKEYIMQFSHEANLEGEVPKSALFVPMVLGDVVIGNLSLQNVDHENTFSVSDVSLISTLSNSMSVALENARLFDETNRLLKETEQRTAELSVINSVQEGLAKELDMQGIYNLVGERVQKLFNAQVVLIATFDHENQLENFNYHFEKGEISHPNPRPFDKGRKYLIETGQNILINENITKAAAEYGMRVVPGTEMPKSILFMPLKVGDKVTGYVSLQNIDRENAFSPSDVRLLSTLSNSMSVALENARLFDETNRLLKETEQRTAELSVINSVQEGLAKELHMQAIYEMVGDKLSEVMHTLDIDIRLFSPETNQVFYPYMRDHGERMDIPPQPMRGMSKYVYETCQTLIINEKLEERMVELGSIPIPGTQMEKSYMAVPIIVGNTALGMVSMSNYEKENAFSDSEVRLLQTVVSAMSVALENARLFDETTRLLKETEQRTTELAVINSVQEGLAKELDIQSIYDLVGNRIRDVFNAQVVVIGTLDSEKKTERFNYAIEKGERFYLSSRPYDKLREHLIESKEKVLINDNYEEAASRFGMNVIPGSEHPKSLLFVPLIIGEKVKSYVSLQNVDEENAFSESDIRLLETLANSMSVALENARLFDETNRLLKETEQRTSELAVINSVQEGLVAQMDIQSIYDLVGEKIRNIFNAQIIDIVTYDKEKNLIEDRYAFEKGDRTLLGEREPLGFRKHVIDNRQVFLINEKMDEIIKQYESYVTIGEQPKSALFVPMITGGEVTGIISLQNLDHEHAFSDSAVNLLTTLANSMSVALKSAGLFDETNRLLKETEQRNAELAVINSVQESLVAKLDMAGIYELVGEKIRQIFGAQVIDIVTYDPTRNVIADQYAYEKGDRTLLGEREPNGFRKHVIKTGVLLLHNENVERAMREFKNEILIGEVPKSQIYVPMISDGKVKGIISLQNLDHEHAFSDSDVSLLTTLSNSMSVALESARLFDETNRLLKETEQRTSELAVINSVQEGLVAQMDMQAIYDLVGEKIRNIFNAQIIDIVTYDKKNNLIEDRYSYEKGDKTLLGPREPLGFRKHVIESPHVFLVNEKLDELSKEYDSYVTIGEQPKSAVFVPMMTGGEITGIISLQNLDHEHAFSESDVNLLTTLANSMSVALKSAGLFDETNRLLQETEQRNAELAVINSVQDSLVAKMDMAGIYELVGEKIREIFNAQVIDIVTYDPDRNVLVDKYSYEKGDRTLVGERKPTGFRKHIIQTGSLLVHNENVEAAMLEFGNEILIGDMPKSQIYVPMIADGRVKGIISLQNLDQEHAFSESDVSLLTTLTNSMSVALESARLFDETTRLLKETEQRNAELAVITSVQESLVAKMDVEAIYYLVGEKMREVFNAQVIDIATYDSATNLIEDKYAYEKGDRTLVSKREPYGFRKHVIDTGQILVINKDMYKQRLIYDNQVIVGQAAKSLVMAPLMAAGKVNGVISLQNLDKENAFSQSEISLLSTLVNSMSVALKSARLFDETIRLLKETEQRTAELGVINSVQEGLVREMNTQSIFNLVGDRICGLFPETQTMVIRTFDVESGLENWQYAIEKGVRLKNETRPLIWANKQLIINKKPFLINENYIETAKKYGGAGVSKGQPPKSAVFVPMIVGDEVKGSLSLQNVDKENAFTDADIRLLTTVTNSMSVAIENARLFDETTRLLRDAKQRATELSTVNSISKALASQLNPTDLIQLVGNQLKELFNANIVYLALLNKKTNIIYFPYQFGDDMTPIKLGEGLTSNIILKGEPLLINKSLDEETDQLGLQRIGIPAASYLGVPIPVGDEIIGVLSVQSTEQENRFDENDQRLLSTIGSSVGVALKNAQLFEDVKQAKMEAELATKNAEKANQAKSAFLSTVSHELRTPLTSVLGFAKIIRKRLEEKIFTILDKTDPKTLKTIDQITENLKVVISEGERLTHLINDVLDLAKIEAGKMEWDQENVSLAEVVERAVAATTSLFDQKDIKLVTHIDTDIPTIIGDNDKLIQVVINLFSNAVKFTDKGSVTCKLYQKNNEAIVSISDTGIGIAKEDFGAVFEQFKQVGGDTLTDKPKGTGLGLPICKEIVEHHGGRIWLESKVGKGSTFSFALPLIPSGPKNKDTPIHLNELMKQLKEQMVFSKLKIDGKNATILVVDDDDSIRSLLHQELSDAGYVIEEAKDGKMALESIRKNRPDLIILDVMMPEINGFDVAAILKNDPQTMDIPIIILSIVQDKARGFRIGVDRYLTKPIDTAKLFEEVGSLLEQGKSKKKVMVVDEDSSAVRSLTEVLQTKGYIVVESDGKELVEKAISTQPDIIILNSVLSDKNEIVQSLRFEKGLENVLFLIYQ